MQYNSLKDAIPVSWKGILCQCDWDEQDSKYDKLLAKEKIVAEVYSELSMDMTIMHTKWITWQKVLQCSLPYEEFLENFRASMTVCITTKFRSFQYRLIQNELITNQLLHKWAIAQSPMCTFCDENQETILHLFVYCEYVQAFWIQVEELMNEYDTTPIDF